MKYIFKRVLLLAIIICLCLFITACSNQFANAFSQSNGIVSDGMNSSAAANKICKLCNNEAKDAEYAGCTEHNCHTADCKLLKADGFNYCLEHKCDEPDCHSAKSKGSDFCADHKCKATDCPSAKSKGSDFCADHKCKATDCPSAKSKGFDYCADHKCDATDCKSIRLDGFNYCLDHKCDEPDCSLKKEAESFYCILHKCYVNTCNNKKADISEGCKLHTCTEKDCNYKQLDGFTLCTYHKYMTDSIALSTVKIPYNDHTKLIAHRGGALKPENTCSAFEEAGNHSWYGIETDIRITADGEFILIHDDDTGRVADKNIVVSESTLAQLRELKLKNFDNTVSSDLQFALLEEYLDICKKYDKVAILELKNVFSKEQLQKIQELVSKHHDASKAVYVSFWYENLQTLRELSADVKLQFLCKELSEKTVQDLAKDKIDLSMDYFHLTQELVTELHNAGLKVNCWTVNNPATAQQLITWGVDYITTDILEYSK